MPDEPDVVDVIFKMNRELGEISRDIKHLREAHDIHAKRTIKNQARFHRRITSLESTRLKGLTILGTISFVGGAAWNLLVAMVKH